MSAHSHGVSAVIIGRDPNVWQLTCDCGDAWTGPTYESAEDLWRSHVYDTKGHAPKPMGDKANRWEPAS